LFEATIFDWDGTLANTREVILASFHEALREVAKIDVSDEFIERRIGVGAANTFREILAAKGLKFDDELVRRLVSVKVRVEVDRTGDVQLFPGARELLESLNGKVKMALASMNNRTVIDHMLDHLQVQGFFSIVLTGDEVAHSKPDPEIFLKSAKKLGSKPEKSVVLEDSIFGVRAAKAGKMACIAVAQGAYSSRELAKAKPNLLLNSLQEKDAILKFILK
jgi:beta-phosphoglucomutase-like phosphatase (HAD superfamily)